MQFLHCEHYDGQLEGKIRQAILSTVTTISFGKSKVQHYESTKVVVSSIVYTFLHLEGICEFSDAFHRRDLKLLSFIRNCNILNSHGVTTVLMYSTLMSLHLLNCFFKVKKNLKGSLEVHWKFKLWEEKFAWDVNAKHCWPLSANFLYSKVYWQHPAIFCLFTFPAHTLNFHWKWRWWDQIQAIFLNIFYFEINFNLVSKNLVLWYGLLLH